MKNIKYRIGTDLFSLFPVVITLLVFGGVSVWLYLFNNGMFIFTGFLTSVMLVILLYILYSYFFIKLLICEDGFYYQKGVGNGKYYKYTAIAEAWESEGKVTNGVINYYLNFKTENGRVIKFNFTAAQSEGIEYLLERVNGQGENSDAK